MGVGIFIPYGYYSMLRDVPFTGKITNITAISALTPYQRTITLKVRPVCKSTQSVSAVNRKGSLIMDFRSGNIFPTTKP